MEMFFYVNGVRHASIDSYQYAEGQKKTSEIATFGGNIHVSGRKEPDTVSFSFKGLPLDFDGKKCELVNEEASSTLQIEHISSSYKDGVVRVRAIVLSSN